uniref:F-box only protein 21-like n=1 Tax=Saccoglossus kowalevskii TaxID=10224 RepID=A0ABM0LYE0_SACKO|nr:PREDICTED: F-box only protein 21-like [Saccoglossus kowalevskii]
MAGFSPSFSGGRTINELADEIIEAILCQRKLDHTDIASFSLTCHRFRAISLSREIWRNKFVQRWPALSDVCIDSKQKDWLDVYKLRETIHHSIQPIICKLSPLYYHLDDVSNEGFSEIQDIFTSSDIHCEFVQDELLAIIYDNNKRTDLTKKYYAEKCLRFVQHYSLAKEWRRFLELPQEEQLLEHGAVLLAQWCQSTLQISMKEIKHKIDKLACLVHAEIKTRCPNHPVRNLQVPCKVEMTPSQGRQVLECLNTVLYKQQKFTGNDVNYYEKMNSYINKVLERKTGIPISLAILYASIASRFSVQVQTVNFPNHFLLRYKDGCTDEDYIYIDVFNQGKLLQRKECIQFEPAVGSTMSRYFNSCPPKAVFTRMVANLLRINPHHDDNGGLRDALELYLILCPNDIEVRLLQARVYLHLNINLQEVVENLTRLMDHSLLIQVNWVEFMLNEAKERLSSQALPGHAEVQLKCREDNNEVQFSVGMIMKHKLQNGVILMTGSTQKGGIG